MISAKRRFRRHSSWLFAQVLSAAGLPAQAQDPVKLGLIVPLSGPWARQGEVMRVGAEMAIDHINAQGGIAALGGRAVELVVFDTGDSVERAKNAAQRMVAEEPDLVGITGSYLSSFTLAVSEVTERAELPMLTLSYSDLITGRDFRYIFQTSPTGVQQAEDALPIIMQLAQSASGARPGRLGIVMDSTAASVAFVKPIKEGGTLEALDLDLVVDETFTPPLANATPLIQRRGRLPTVSNGSAMGDPDLLANMPEELLEGIMTVVANWSTRGQESITAEFIERSGEPWITQNPICAYGHIWLLKEALEAAGVADRNAVADAIRTMDLTDGPARFFPGGRVRFDEFGRRIDAELLVVQWQDGEPMTVYPDSAAVAEPIWPSGR